jgi:hypothetical protein
MQHIVRRLSKHFMRRCSIFIRQRTGVLNMPLFYDDIHKMAMTIFLVRAAPRSDSAHVAVSGAELVHRVARHH